MMLTLFSAGGESTASLLGSAVWILASEPDVQRQLRQDKELLGPFIEEVLRYEPPFRGHYRHVLTTPPSAALSCPQDPDCCCSGERPTVTRINSTRRTNSDSTAQRQRTPDIWKGRPFCVGASLARLEARVVLGLLLERTSWIEAADRGRWLSSILVRPRLEATGFGGEVKPQV